MYFSLQGHRRQVTASAVPQLELQAGKELQRSTAPKGDELLQGQGPAADAPLHQVTATTMPGPANRP
jgi:hypothetical protein